MNNAAPSIQKALDDLYARQRASLLLRRLRGDDPWIPPHGALRPSFAIVGHLGSLSRDLVIDAIQAAGLEVSECYFTDVFKHRTLDCRPDVDDYETALRFLEDEFTILKPKVVILLGQHPVQAMMANTTISKHDGCIYPWGKFWLAVCINPALAILDPVAKECIRDTFAMAAAHIALPPKAGN